MPVLAFPCNDMSFTMNVRPLMPKSVPPFYLTVSLSLCFVRHSGFLALLLDIPSHDLFDYTIRNGIGVLQHSKAVRTLSL